MRPSKMKGRAFILVLLIMLTLFIIDIEAKKNKVDKKTKVQSPKVLKTSKAPKSDAGSDETITTRAGSSTVQPSLRNSTRRMQSLTGPGSSAARYGVGGTDLGIARLLPNGKVGYFFGDTFDGFTVGGNGWRSPVLLRSQLYSPETLDAGVFEFTEAAGGNYARQILPYTHNVGFSTVLPTDVVVVGGGLMIMHVMVIGFGGLSDVRWTEMQWSRDNGETWTHAGDGGVRQGGDFDSHFQMLTWEWEPETDWVYVMTSKGLARNGGVYLWRVKGYEPFNKSKWQGWGWNGANWDWNRYPSNIMPQGVTVGEMNLRKVQNNWLFTYFETSSGRIVTKVLSQPNANVHTAPTYVIISNGPTFSESAQPNSYLTQPYGGYLMPGSTLRNPHYIISQWDTSDNWPYWVVHFAGRSMTPVNPI